MGGWFEAYEAVEFFERRKSVNVLYLGEELHRSEWSDTGNGAQQFGVVFIAFESLQSAHLDGSFKKESVQEMILLQQQVECKTGVGVWELSFLQPKQEGFCPEAVIKLSGYWYSGTNEFIFDPVFNTHQVSPKFLAITKQEAITLHDWIGDVNGGEESSA
jgi:hypothetical protein